MSETGHPPGNEGAIVSLMGIGEFAQRSRLSARALRLYDELGLLSPDRVDPGSGYRWYGPAQLRRAQLVASMRQIGMPLAEIKTIAGLDPHAAAEYLARYWAAADAEHTARRALTWSLVAQLTGKVAARFPDLTGRTEPAHEEAFVHLPTAQVGQTEIMAIIQALESWAAEEQRQPSAALRQVFIAPPGTSSGDGPACDFAVPLVRVKSGSPA